MPQSDNLNRTRHDDLSVMQLPLWQDLPSFDLHLDQLLELTNNYLKPITGAAVTKTMMHNYFKAEILVPPDKKSYHQIHLAGAIVVGLLKEIFSLDELRVALKLILNNDSPKSGYNRFVTLFNSEAANGTFKHAKLSPAKQTEMSTPAAIQYNAVEAILFWISAKRLLNHAIDEK